MSGGTLFSALDTNGDLFRVEAPSDRPYLFMVTISDGEPVGHAVGLDAADVAVLHTALGKWIEDHQ